MTYDPRRGSSPYLGMDFDDEPDGGDQAAGSSRQRMQGKARLAQERTPQQKGRDVPPTMLRRPQPPQHPSLASSEGDSAPSRNPYARAGGSAQNGRAQRQRAFEGNAQANGQVLRRETPHVIQAVPSPAQQAYVPEPSSVPTMIGRRVEGPLTTLKATLLVLLAWILRLGAWALALFVVVSASLTGSMRAQLISRLSIAALLVPPSLLGLFVRDTPFGGILRGDMVIVSVILFCADWFCLRLSSSLRRRRDRRI